MGECTVLVNLGLVEDYGARWSKVEQIGGVWSTMGKSGATWRSVGRYGEVWSNVEKSRAKWRGPEQHGKVRSNVEECREIWKGLEIIGASVEKGYVFYFDYKLESCPEAIELLYKTSEIPE